MTNKPANINDGLAVCFLHITTISLVRFSVLLLVLSTFVRLILSVKDQLTAISPLSVFVVWYHLSIISVLLVEMATKYE